MVILFWTASLRLAHDHEASRRLAVRKSMNRLILDTDGGVDDAQALLLLIANGRSPAAVTTVFGNVDLDTATRNVLSVLAVAGATIDVHKGAHEPLEQEIIHAREVHGEDGLGGAPRPHAIAEIAGSDAAGLLVTELSIAATTGQPIDLLFIGPLTNLAMALQAAPGICLLYTSPSPRDS